MKTLNRLSAFFLLTSSIMPALGLASESGEVTLDELIRAATRTKSSFLADIVHHDRLGCMSFGIYRGKKELFIRQSDKKIDLRTETNLKRTVEFERHISEYCRGNVIPMNEVAAASMIEKVLKEE